MSEDLSSPSNLQVILRRDNSHMTEYQPHKCHRCARMRSGLPCQPCLESMHAADAWNKRFKKLVERNRRTKYKRTYKDWRLRNQYGITIEDYETKLKAQGYCCAACGEGKRPRRYLCVDYCHKTNRVRGILCPSCHQSVKAIEKRLPVLGTILEYLITSR